MGRVNLSRFKSKFAANLDLGVLKITVIKGLFG